MANNGESPRTRQTVGNTHSSSPTNKSEFKMDSTTGYHVQTGDSVIMKSADGRRWHHGVVAALHLDRNGDRLATVVDHGIWSIHRLQRVVKAPRDPRPTHRVQPPYLHKLKQTIGYKI